MRRVLSVLILAMVLASLAVPAMAVSGTHKECLYGCPLGVNDCNNCCDKAVEGCLYSAQNKYQQCKDACGLTVGACKSDCMTQHKKDRDYCTSEKKINFQCPGWQAPQECPYDCQTWNPVSRSCVGARMNGCN